MTRHWNAAEDAILRRHYATEGAKGCVARLHKRSIHSVTARARRLNVAGEHVMWEPHEISILRAEYPGGGYIAVVQRLPRLTAKQVQCAARRHGVRRLLAA